MGNASSAAADNGGIQRSRAITGGGARGAGCGAWGAEGRGGGLPMHGGLAGLARSACAPAAKAQENLLGLHWGLCASHTGWGAGWLWLAGECVQHACTRTRTVVRRGSLPPHPPLHAHMHAHPPSTQAPCRRGGRPCCPSCPRAPSGLRPRSTRSWRCALGGASGCPVCGCARVQVRRAGELCACVCRSSAGANCAYMCGRADLPH